MSPDRRTDGQTDSEYAQVGSKTVVEVTHKKNNNNNCLPTSTSLEAKYIAIVELLYHIMENPATNPASKPCNSLSSLRNHRSAQFTAWKRNQYIWII